MASKRVVVGVSNGKTSNSALKWVLDNFVSPTDVVVLLHVRPPLKMIPSPKGDLQPIEKFEDHIVETYRQSIESKTDSMFRCYKGTCDLYQVQTEYQLIEHESVKEALVEQIAILKIRILVLGASSHSALLRKVMGPKNFDHVAQHAPDYCSVLVVSNKTMKCVKNSNGSLPLSTTPEPHPPSSTPENSHVAVVEIEEEGNRDAGMVHRRPKNQSTSDFVKSREANRPSNQPFKGQNEQQFVWVAEEHLPSDISPRSSISVKTAASAHGMTKKDVASNYYPIPEPAVRFFPNTGGRLERFPTEPTVTEQNCGSYFSTKPQELYQLPHPQDVETLGRRLDHALLLLEKAQKLAELQATEREKADITAAALAMKVKQLEAKQVKEERKLAEALEAIKAAETRISEETRKHMETLEAVESAKKESEKEGRLRMYAEAKSVEHEAARQAAVEALKRAKQRYREFTYAEVSVATNGFSGENILGEGKYGTVFKGTLQSVSVAIKVLRDKFQWESKLQKEVELLGRIHHPHVVLLLGCCPDNRCLVYEYMAKGRLEDQLFPKEDSTPRLPWHARFRILAEVATALLFLHSTKPEPVVHRDLKPGNIFLDQNYVSKLGDVGLARLLPPRAADRDSFYARDTTPLGTLGYMDPEYQQTGVVSPRSDVYAFGIVILQLLTGKPPLGVIKLVKAGLDSRANFAEVLDQSAGMWPVDEARQLAQMALQCAQLHPRDRPDLEKHVLPRLETLKALTEAHATEASSSGREEDTVPPMFFCPISQEIMENPVIAADGYTYEMLQISQWLAHNDTSPMTNLILEHKKLTPNYNLRSAILEWKDSQL